MLRTSCLHESTKKKTEFNLTVSKLAVAIVKTEQQSLFCILSILEYSLSETRRGWKFGLTPLPSLRSKAHKAIREILPYIRAGFAFKLGHANFPICIYCLLSTPSYQETWISYLCIIEDPQNEHLGNFWRHENGCHSLHICAVYTTQQVENATIVTMGCQYNVVFKQLMRVRKLAGPSLNANRAQIYGKISRITLWVFDLRLGRGISPNFQPRQVSLRLTWVHVEKFYCCT